jgi:hypothetical protein
LKNFVFGLFSRVNYIFALILQLELEHLGNDDSIVLLQVVVWFQLDQGFSEVAPYSRDSVFLQIHQVCGENIFEHLKWD